MTGAGIGIDAPLTLVSNSVLTLDAAGDVSQSAAGDISATQLLLAGASSYALATAGANAIDTLAATGAGVVAFANDGALQIGTVDGVSGIAASGPVSIATASGDLTIAQAIVTADTGPGALVLNAGSASAAGTAAGGDIVLAGSPLLATGSGGRATLYTGSIAGSTGVTAAVGAGSGRFRYGSDETTSAFTTTLAAGAYAVYREQPTITMTAASAGMVYGDSVPALPVAVSGAVNGDAITATAAVGGDVSAAGHYTVAGPHPVSPDTASAQALGYAVVTTDGVLTVVAKDLALQGASGLVKVYDGRTFLPVAGYGALNGVLAGDTVLAQGDATYATAGAGSQAVVQGSVALAGVSAGNYRLVWIDGAGTITPAPLTVVANNDARFVSQADVAGYSGVSHSGFVDGETAAVLTGVAVVTRSNAGTVAAGTYPGVLVPAGVSAANYAITFAPGDYTIVPANRLLVRVPDANSTYGSSVTYGAPQASYLAGDNTTIVDLSGSVTAAGNTLRIDDGAGGAARFTVGPAEPLFAGSGALAVGSYQLGASDVTATSANFSNTLVVVGAHQVEPRGVTLTPGGATKVYDGSSTMSGLQLAATGLLVGDSATPAGQGAFAGRNVGTGLAYSVTGLHLAGADAGNYYLIGGSSLSGTDGSITPKVLTLTAPVVNKVYDGSPVYTADAATLAALSQQLGVAGDAVSGISLRFDDKNVGASVPLTPSAAVIADGNGGLNYQLVYAPSLGNSITQLASVTWTGGATGQWFDPANWAGGAAPDLANVATVVIPQNVTVSFGPTVIAPAQAGPVQIDRLGDAGALDMQGGQLLVGSGGVTLGALTQSGGSLISAGDVTLGRFGQTGGSLVVVGQFGTTGPYAQTGDGSVAVGGATQIVGSAGGVVLGRLDSTGPLVVTSGGGNITQTGPLVIGGDTTIDAGSGHLRLDDRGNRFGGATVFRGATVSVFDPDARGSAPPTAAERWGAIQAGLADGAARDTTAPVSPSCGPTMQLATRAGADAAPSAPVESIGHASRGSGFEFEVPDRVARTLRSASTSTLARRADGSPLPAWLTFDAERLRLRAATVPSGALPIELSLLAGNEDVRLSIGNGDAGRGRCGR